MINEEIISGTAYAFERLGTGTWIWSVQICTQPEHYTIGTSLSQGEAVSAANAAEKLLRRLALRATNLRLDRLGA